MNPSERIRAALLRSDATKPSTTVPEFEAKTRQIEPKAPKFETKAEVERSLRLLAETEVDRGVSAPSAGVDPAPLPKRAAAPESPPASNANAPIGRFRRGYVIVAALALVALAAVLTRDRWSASLKSTPAAPRLQIEVKSEGNGLMSVRWNPASTPIVQAREGRLVILEANQQPRVVPLQAEQLKSGHVYYQSTAERLEFELEITSPSGTTVKESVLALSSGRAETPSAANPAASEQQTPSAQTKNAVSVEAKADRNAKADKNKPKTEPNDTPLPPPEPPPQRPAARVFTPPPAPVGSATVEDARAVLLDPSTAPTAVAPARLNLPQAISAAPPLKAPSAPAPSQKINVGGMVQAPVLLKKVAPVYPQFARSSRTEGVVKFTATIDKQGRVRNLQLLGGPQLLVKAAADAVKQWVYRPMQLDGSAMEVITQIEVRFALKD